MFIRVMFCVFKQKTAYEMRISDWSSDVCSSDLKSSQMALEVINPVLPEAIGGSADLTGSNNTKTAGLAPVKPGDFSGRYMYYGVREHGMAAAEIGRASRRARVGAAM